MPGPQLLFQICLTVRRRCAADSYLRLTDCLTQSDWQQHFLQTKPNCPTVPRAGQLLRIFSLQYTKSLPATSAANRNLTVQQRPAAESYLTGENVFRNETKRNHTAEAPHKLHSECILLSNLCISVLMFHVLYFFGGLLALGLSGRRCRNYHNSS